jgi:methionine synthase I (cobalamin-dependent)
VCVCVCVCLFVCAFFTPIACVCSSSSTFLLSRVSTLVLARAGLNCALGADQMRPFLARLSQIAQCYISAYPNAGLPNAMGGYDETPADMAPRIERFARDGLLNMVLAYAI